MNMNEIPTPETDAVEKEFTVDSKQNPQHRLALKSRNLERRLTIAREALKIVAKYPIARTHLDGPCIDRFDLLEVCRALALTATEP